MSEPQTLHQMLLERAGRVRSLDPDDVMIAIADHLALHPEHIEELAPGMQLVRKPISKEERAKRMTIASKLRREEVARERYKKIVPIIQKARAANPAITLREIAALLDKSGIKPQRSERWSAASVQFVMNKTGIE